MSPDVLVGLFALAGAPLFFEQYNFEGCGGGTTVPPDYNYTIDTSECTPLLTSSPDDACFYSGDKISVIQVNTNPVLYFVAPPPLVQSTVISGFQSNPDRASAYIDILRQYANVFQYNRDITAEGIPSPGPDPESDEDKFVDAIKNFYATFGLPFSPPADIYLSFFVFSCDFCLNVDQSLPTSGSFRVICSDDNEEPVAAYVAVGLAGVISIQYLITFLFDVGWGFKRVNLEKYGTSTWALAGAGVAFGCSIAALVLVIILCDDTSNRNILNYALLQTFSGLQAGYFLVQLGFLPLLARDYVSAVAWLLRICAAIQLAALGVAVAMATESSIPDEIYAILGLSAGSTLWVTLYDGYVYINSYLLQGGSSSVGNKGTFQRLTM